MTRPLPLSQEASSAEAGLIQGLTLAQVASSAGTGFLSILTTDFKVWQGVTRASLAAGFHTGFHGSRISWLQSKVGLWILATGPGEFQSSMGICQPLFGLILTLDWELLQWKLLLLDLDPALLEQDSLLCLSCMVCKALSLLQSQSKYNGSLFQGSATSTGVSITFSVWIEHSTTFRVSGPSCLLRPGGGGRVLWPGLNLASAMRVQGSNCGLDGGGSWEAGTLAGTLNMSENWSSSLKGSSV